MSENKDFADVELAEQNASLWKEKAIELLRENQELTLQVENEKIEKEKVVENYSRLVSLIAQTETVQNLEIHVGEEVTSFPNIGGTLMEVFADTSTFAITVKEPGVENEDVTESDADHSGE